MKNVTVDLDALEHLVELFSYEVDYWDESRNPNARKSLVKVLEPLVAAGSDLRLGRSRTTLKKEISDIEEALAEEKEHP